MAKPQPMDTVSEGERITDACPDDSLSQMDDSEQTLPQSTAEPSSMNEEIQDANPPIQMDDSDVNPR